MGTAVAACTIMSAVGALASGVGLRGFAYAMSACCLTAAVLLSLFWVLGIMP